jgi:hypothetical protein
MTKREPLLTEDYFDNDINLVREYIHKRETNMAGYQNQVMARFQVMRYHFSLTSSMYSRGYDMKEVRDEFTQFIESWETLREADTTNQYLVSLKDDIGSYVECIGLLARAYLLNLPSPLIIRLLECMEYNGQDLLFERLVAAGKVAVAHKPAKKLLYPKVYQPLYDALDASVDQQPKLVQQFLQNWYKRIKNVGWHDAHKGPGGGGFFGYWCWEAAGVAHAFGIDDSSFRDLPYYPKDLADHAQPAE